MGIRNAEDAAWNLLIELTHDVRVEGRSLAALTVAFEADATSQKFQLMPTVRQLLGLLEEDNLLRSR